MRTALALALIALVRATGIQPDPMLHRVARRARSKLSHVIDTSAAELVHGDFFGPDVSRYDVPFYLGSGTFAENRLYRTIGRKLSDALFLLAYPAGRVEGMAHSGTYGFVHLYRGMAHTMPQP